MRLFIVAGFLIVIILIFGLPSYAFDPCDEVTANDLTISDECLALIEDFPEPLVEEIPLDGYTLSEYRFWRVGPHAVNLYDTPGGSIVGQIAEGFNFVRAIDTSVEGWIQSAGGQWLSRSDARPVEPSYFRGVLLPNGLEDQFAWILDKTGIYTSEYPGGPPSEETGRVPRRYERVNIFAEAVDMEGWTWYMIGPHQWVNQRFVGVVKPVERPEGVQGRWVVIDQYEQTLVSYEDDIPVFATLVSTGLPDWDTNEGLFTVWARVVSDGMSGATGAPDAYALQSVPWVMYFDEDISLHGTYWHDDFGYRRSHGCVNLSISDSHYLFEWADETTPDENGGIVTYVYVYSSGVYSD